STAARAFDGSPANGSVGRVVEVAAVAARRVVVVAGRTVGCTVGAGVAVAARCTAGLVVRCAVRRAVGRTTKAAVVGVTPVLVVGDSDVEVAEAAREAFFSPLPHAVATSNRPIAGMRARLDHSGITPVYPEPA